MVFRLLTSVKLINAYPTLDASTNGSLGSEENCHILAVIGKVDTKVHKVIATKARLIDYLFQHCLVNLVGDITKHDLRQGQYGTCAKT